MGAHNSRGKSKTRGIIVLGTPRSGTTLLRRILNAHPDIACPGETNIFSACARFLRSEKIAENVEIGVIAGLEHAGFEKQEIIRRLQEFAFSFHQDHAAEKGKFRWAEKTAFDSFYIDEIEELCGEDALFICMIRNGMDFVVSMQELCIKNQTYLHEIHDYIRRYPKPLEAFAHCWRDLTSRILEFTKTHPENTVLVKYEDLVAELEITLKIVFDFIGGKYQQDLVKTALSNTDDIGLGDWKTYQSDTVNRESVNRARTLSRRTKSELGQIMNELLERCGYKPANILEDTDEEARRRYQLGLQLAALNKDRK